MADELQMHGYTRLVAAGSERPTVANGDQVTACVTERGYSAMHTKKVELGVCGLWLSSGAIFSQLPLEADGMD